MVSMKQAMESLKYLGDNPKLEIRNVNDEYFEARVVSGPQEMPWQHDKEPHGAIYKAMCAWDSRCEKIESNGSIEPAATYCCRTCTDFGHSGRKDVIREHKNREAAERAFSTWVKIYHDIHKSRVWIEDMDGNVLRSTS